MVRNIYTSTLKQILLPASPFKKVYAFYVSITLHNPCGRVPEMSGFTLSTKSD
jgi:hypothetical protein